MHSFGGGPKARGYEGVIVLVSQAETISFSVLARLDGLALHSVKCMCAIWYIRATWFKDALKLRSSSNSISDGPWFEPILATILGE